MYSEAQSMSSDSRRFSVERQAPMASLKRISWLSIGRKKHKIDSNLEQCVDVATLPAEKEPLQLAAAVLQIQSQSDDLLDARCSLECDIQQVQAQRLLIETESKQLAVTWRQLQAEKQKLQAEVEQLQLDREQATQRRHDSEQQMFQPHHMQQDSAEKKHQLHPSTPPATAETVTAARGLVLSRSPSLSRTPSLSRSASTKRLTDAHSRSSSPKAALNPLDPTLTPAQAAAAAAAAQEAVHQAIHDAATAAAAAAAAAAAVQQYYNQQQLQDSGLRSLSSTEFNPSQESAGNAGAAVSDNSHNLGHHIHTPQTMTPSKRQAHHSGHHSRPATAAMPTTPEVQLVAAGTSDEEAGHISIQTTSIANRNVAHISRTLTVKTSSTADGGDGVTEVVQPPAGPQAVADHGPVMDLHEHRRVHQHLEQQRAELAAERRQLDKQRSDLAEWSHMLRNLQHSLEQRAQQLQKAEAQQHHKTE